MVRLSLGDRIKFIRKEKKLSQVAFGKLLTPPADSTVVSRWENNTNVPNKSRLTQIAKMGNVSIGYLKNGTTDTNMLQNAIYATNIGQADIKDQTVMNDFAADAIATQQIKNRIINTESHEALKNLVSSHYKKFNNFSISSRGEFLDNSKLLELFEKYNIETDDGVLNHYSEAMSELIRQISTFAKDQTAKNKKAAKVALNKLLDSLKYMDQ